MTAERRQPPTIPYAARFSSTVEEACVATGLGKTKIYELIAAGQIETATVGTRRLVLVRSIIRLIDPTPVPTPVSTPVSGEPWRTAAEADAPGKRDGERDRKPVSANTYGRRRTRANAYGDG